MPRSTMAALITKVRSLINDPSGGGQVFTDDDIQDQLDALPVRLNIRYEALTPAPVILNAASTNNIAVLIWCDYYSRFQWWEDDVVLEGTNVNTLASWKVLTPATSENFFGHWAFESSVFTSGTAPGQYPPVFATGKSFDVWLAAANLLEMWSARYTLAYNVTTDNQIFLRGQILDAQIKLAEQYRRRARAVSVTPLRMDLVPKGAGQHSEHTSFFGSNDKIGGDW
jgi:hypothetical protein